MNLKMNYLCRLLKWVVIVQFSTGYQAVSSSCGVSSVAKHGSSDAELISKRIIGGMEAAKHSWPWQAYIRYNKGADSLLCSGVLVSPHLLLTVAQCTPSRDPKDYVIVLNEHDVSRYEGNETVHKARRIIVPKRFNRTTLAHDIALVQLKTGVSSANIGFVCLPPPSYYTDPGTECYMTGWGVKMNSHGLGMARTLQELKIPVASENACGRSIGRKIPDINLCGGSVNSSSGGCNFDKGSPLVCLDNNSKRWILQGLFSYSSEPCSSNKTRYSIFTRISVYSRAVQKMIKKSRPTPVTHTTATIKTTIKQHSSTSMPISATSFTSSRQPTLNSRVSSKAASPITTSNPVTKVSTTHAPTATRTTAKHATPKKPLRIILRSEGCNDSAKTSRFGEAFISVNGESFSKHRRGHNIVIVDVETGKVEESVAFDTRSYKEYKAMDRFLMNVKPRRMLLVAVQGDGSRYQVALHRKLIRFGATYPFQIGSCSSYCLIGYTGPDSVAWTRQESRMQSKGPSEINEVVPTPNEEFVRIRVHSAMMVNQRDEKKRGDAYIWVNGNDQSSHIDGHNVVTIDFDTGKINQKLGFHTNSSLRESKALARLLTNVRSRQIVVVVIQSGSSKYHWMIRKALNRFGASSELELERKRLYAFIGYSGPEKVSWTTETQSNFDESSIDVKVYIRKGFSTCGISSRPTPTIVKYVVGGSASSESSWPWMAAMVDGNHKLICGASIVTDEWLVTAAHCIEEMKLRPRPYKVILGSTRYAEEEADENIGLVDSYAHPMFKSATYDYDIAVIKLQKKITIRDDIRTICFGKEVDRIRDNCYVSGWGRLHQNGNYSNKLVHAKVPIVANHICNETKLYRGKITERMLCAGFQEGGVDSCQGDSGGPLSCKDMDGYWHLVGVVSWGIGCARPHHYGVYTDINNLKDWILKKMKENVRLA